MQDLLSSWWDAGSLVAVCELLVAACMWGLVLWPGLKDGPPSLEMWNLSHWTTREVLVALMKLCVFLGRALWARRQGAWDLIWSQPGHWSSLASFPILSPESADCWHHLTSFPPSRFCFGQTRPGQGRKKHAHGFPWNYHLCQSVLNIL